jgi:hypothetical protein
MNADIYPSSPGAAPVDTSREAAESLEGSVAGLRRVVLDGVRCYGHGLGATCEEVEDWLAMPHQTVSARLRELELLGLVVKTSDRRLNVSGRSARVYRIATTNPPLADAAELRPARAGAESMHSARGVQPLLL